MRVLVVAADAPLGQTRGQVLRMAGCSAVVATYEEARQVACIERFHVAVICQSIQAEKARMLARELRRYLPAIRVVRVILCSDDSEYGFDRVVTAPVAPWVLQHIVVSCGNG